jgi:hypothetical protein
MRITKKYAGSSSIGKQLFQPCEPFEDMESVLDAHDVELAGLEARFLERIAGKKCNNSRGSRRPMDGNDDTDPFDPLQQHPSPHLEREQYEQLQALCTPQRLVYSLPYEAHALRKLHASKRVASAPNLSTMDARDRDHYERDATSAFYNNDLNKEPYARDDNIDNTRFSRLPAIGEEFNVDVFRQQTLARERERERKLAQHVTSVANATGWKRSRSVMAFMDFEKLAADDKAAGECSLCLSVSLCLSASSPVPFLLFSPIMLLCNVRHTVL